MPCLSALFTGLDFSQTVGVPDPEIRQKQPMAFLAQMGQAVEGKRFGQDGALDIDPLVAQAFDQDQDKHRHLLDGVAGSLVLSLEIVEAATMFDQLEAELIEQATVVFPAPGR